GLLQVYKDGAIGFMADWQSAVALTPGGAVMLAQNQSAVGTPTAGQNYVGSLEEVAVYGTQLSAARIAAHAAAGASYSSAVTADAPLTYWRLGDAPGTTVPADLGTSPTPAGAVVELFLADG